MIEWITCREVVDFLDEYLSGQLEGARLEEFEYHLSSCPPCINYMESYRRAVLLGRQALRRSEDAPPAEVPDRLVEAILEARRR